MPGATLTPQTTLRVASRLRRFIAVFGPGLVVMLADTDVGSVITAGQSGVQWGYRLLPLQFALIPILFTCGILLPAIAVWSLTYPDAVLADANPELAIALSIIGVVLLAVWAMNVLAVRQELGARG